MIRVARVLKCPNHGAVREKRQGIMLHFDDSASDAGAMAWFEDPRCKVSYNWLVLDNGDVVTVAPADRRAWHAGKCRPAAAVQYRDANSAFYGIAAATNSKTPATEQQKDSIIAICRHLMKLHGWTEPWRIVGHDAEAWPRGRKVDPTGFNPERPILSVAEIRAKVAA